MKPDTRKTMTDWEAKVMKEGLAAEPKITTKQASDILKFVNELNGVQTKISTVLRPWSQDTYFRFGLGQTTEPEKYVDAFNQIQTILNPLVPKMKSINKNIINANGIKSISDDHSTVTTENGVWTLVDHQGQPSQNAKYAGFSVSSSDIILEPVEASIHQSLTYFAGKFKQILGYSYNPYKVSAIRDKLNLVFTNLEDLQTRAEVLRKKTIGIKDDQVDQVTRQLLSNRVEDVSFGFNKRILIHKALPGKEKFVKSGVIFRSGRDAVLPQVAK